MSRPDNGRRTRPLKTSARNPIYIRNAIIIYIIIIISIIYCRRDISARRFRFRQNALYSDTHTHTHTHVLLLLLLYVNIVTSQNSRMYLHLPIRRYISIVLISTREARRGARVGV